MTNYNVIIIDLDKTLIDNTQLYNIWDFLKNYYTDVYIFSQQDLNILIDIFKEYLRPNIFVILNYLKHKKKNNSCKKIILYTNNQGKITWAEKIIRYLEDKLNYKLFDKIINAYKINGVKIELCRTTHKKTYEDFLNCTKINNKNLNLCIIDDLYFEEMIKNNVFYIYVKPYNYYYSFNEIIDRLLNNNYYIKIINEKNKNIFINDFKTYYYKKNNDILNSNIDEHKIISKNILLSLQNFFKEKFYTKKNNNKNKKNITYKKKYSVNVIF